jgi:hypothetical protein
MHGVCSAFDHPSAWLPDDALSFAKRATVGKGYLRQLLLRKVIVCVLLQRFWLARIRGMLEANP